MQSLRAHTENLSTATRIRPMMRCAAISLAAMMAGCMINGCETTPEAKSLARKADLDTAPLTHVVLVQLKDPSRATELVADCDEVLPAIEGVSGYSCGIPLVTGRSNVTTDYDVGIYVGFKNEADYRVYVDDPRHLGLVERWRDGWKAVRIYDVMEGAIPVVPQMAAPITNDGKAAASKPLSPVAPGTPTAPTTPPAKPAPSATAPSATAPSATAPAAATSVQPKPPASNTVNPGK